MVNVASRVKEIQVLADAARFRGDLDLADVLDEVARIVETMHLPEALWLLCRVVTNARD